MGITHGKETEGDTSNQAMVLEGLRRAGYSVCFAAVCPSRAGIPMTRQRIHYQGIHNQKVENAAGQIQVLQDVWNSVLKGDYPAHELQDFLDNQVQDPSPPQNRERKADDCKWRTQHKQVFEQYEAGPLISYAQRFPGILMLTIDNH